MIENKNMIWDETPVDVTTEANFIWSIANKVRGVYMPDKYGDVIIPMVIIRKFECPLEPTKQKVLNRFASNPLYPYKAMCRISGYQFYNTSNFNLKELCNDPDHKSTKDIEIVKYDDAIEDYMAREVLPHVPDAKWLWEEDLNKKTPVVKTGAEIPFTRYFYKYQTPTPSEDLMRKFLELDVSINELIARLFT